jgi:site-specific DNA-cytosine methylase
VGIALPGMFNHQIDFLSMMLMREQDKRIFTVRELARSQGFPDNFYFYAEDERVLTVGFVVP